MPLTMTRSIQLELAIDSDQRPRSAGLVPPWHGLSREARPLRIGSRGVPRRVRSLQQRGRAESQACADCGGPLVAGEGARTCVICGKSWRRAS